MSREAMQMALEALESDPISHAGLVSRKQAIAALRQALETEREWVGLTYEEIQIVASKKWWDWEDSFDIEGFSRAIERVLKEKNT